MKTRSAGRGDLGREGKYSECIYKSGCMLTSKDAASHFRCCADRDVCAAEAEAGAGGGAREKQDSAGEDGGSGEREL